MALETLTVVTLVVAVAALVVGVLALRAARDSGRRRPGDVEGVPADVLGLRQEVAALRAEASGSLRHLAVVRYDAFGDSGGRLSWSLALVDESGDGVLLTSIHARSEARTYVKSLRGWSSDQELSSEESEAVSHARP